jgi:hypothetical protein
VQITHLAERVGVAHHLAKEGALHHLADVGAHLLELGVGGDDLWGGEASEPGEASEWMPT